MKLTVKEYATAYNVSIQSVYKRIQRRTIKWVKENNTIYVVVDDGEVENSIQPVQSTYCTELLDIIKRRDSEIKKLSKEIKRLTKRLSKAETGKSEVLEKFIFEMQRLSYQSIDEDEEIIDVKEKKKSKKKKKKKSKK